MKSVDCPCWFALPGSSHTGWWALLMQALCLTFHHCPPKPVNVAFVCLALFFRNKEVHLWIFHLLQCFLFFCCFSLSFMTASHINDYIFLSTEDDLLTRPNAHFNSLMLILFSSILAYRKQCFPLKLFVFIGFALFLISLVYGFLKL